MELCVYIFIYIKEIGENPILEIEGESHSLGSWNMVATSSVKFKISNQKVGLMLHFSKRLFKTMNLTKIILSCDV